MVAIVMGVLMEADGKLVPTCCDSNGGLGDSLLVVELKEFVIILQLI